MRYNFLLSRSQIVSLVSGLAILGLLIFAGGLLSGVYWQLRSDGSRTGTVAADPAPELPLENAPAEPQATPEPMAEELVQEEPVREEPVQEEPAPPEARQEAKRRVYELQLELFRVEANAYRLVEDLGDRGYEPFIVEVLGSEGVPRYTVRIGAYRSLAEAEAAQAEYAATEGKLAVIRYRDIGE